MKFSARILASLSFCHLLNDLMQSLLPSIYPMLKQTFGLSFGQIGLITLVNQIIASVLQPVIGVYTDRRPLPYSLATGMAFTLAGMMLLGFGPTYGAIIAASAMIGLGSAVFHPESSRVARLASGGRHGFAQAFFQVGGNVGSAVGPSACRVFRPALTDRSSIAWFSLMAIVGMLFLVECRKLVQADERRSPAPESPERRIRRGLSRKQTRTALALLLGSALLEICLPGELRQLLHLLSDTPLQPDGTKRAGASLLLSGCGGRGDDLRRAHRRSFRTDGG